MKVIVSWNGGDLSNAPKYYAANPRSWRAGGILGWYARWWEVEEHLRDAKLHLGLGRCQIRSPIGTMKHFYLVLLMRSLLRLRDARQGSEEGSSESGTLTLSDC